MFSGETVRIKHFNIQSDWQQFPRSLPKYVKKSLFWLTKHKSASTYSSKSKFLRQTNYSDSYPIRQWSVRAKNVRPGSKERRGLKSDFSAEIKQSHVLPAINDAAKCSLIVTHFSTSYNLVKLSSFLGKFRTGLIIISDWTSHHNAYPLWTKSRTQLDQSVRRRYCEPHLLQL